MTFNNQQNGLQADNPVRIETGPYINGEFVESSDKKTFKLYSPATHELLPEVYEASIEDTNQAVAAAKIAQPAWPKLSPIQRGEPIKLSMDILSDLCFGKCFDTLNSENKRDLILEAWRNLLRWF
ncbi:hypothetical protein VC83_06522 [Pseudogymnoascus destructans]|uniref:aldehyde dehydrogenase (NAD(+)) n=1 Tax=Pseudogymnoascus destructans TaxID=655981 RepID=A0A177AAQ9_9PEZI|nr:uncharacterized protein VC83_06522 [Pseudogymnoascus destructans]OAF58351.1 hypothetical protein VC83_06522 [Pseudogymnoascus destructans]